MIQQHGMSWSSGLREMLAEFHYAFGDHYGSALDDETGKIVRLRRKLLIEEHKELIDAIDEQNILGIAQELADVVVVAYGTAHSLGIDLDAVLLEVHRANMSKIQPDGTVLRREDGKVLKPPGFTPPDVAKVLGAY